MSALADTPLIRLRETDMLLEVLRVTRAVDLYLADQRRLGRSPRTTAEYERILGHLTDFLRADTAVHEVTADDCRCFLDRWRHAKPNTKHKNWSVLNTFFGWLYLNESLKRSPMERVQPPPKPRSEDLDVVTVASADIPVLLDACQGWTERLAVELALYLGPRRAAISRLRWSDYDRERGKLRFREKGGKTIWKPIPGEFVVTLTEALASPLCPSEPTDYIVPSPGLLRGPGERDARVIWRAVKRVEARTGISVHVHALRGAFAVGYLEQHPGQRDALQELMGHVDPKTTETYLRRLDRSALMENVRDLSWRRPQTAGIGIESLRSAEKEGFEPSSGAKPLPVREGTEPRQLVWLHGVLHEVHPAPLDEVLGHRLYALREPV